MNITFKNNKTHKPITDEQYEKMTNEFVEVLNLMVKPQVMDAEFVGAIMANALHSVECKGGFISKSKIFDTMIDLMSKRLSFNISEGIRKKMESKTKESEEASLPESFKSDEQNQEIASH